MAEGRVRGGAVLGRSGRGLAALLVLAAAGCVAQPGGTETLVIDSRSFGFIDELLAGQAGRPQQVEATLVLPQGGPAGGGQAGSGAPYPAIVLLHSSNGQGSQDWLYAKRLTAQGIAVLAVDSFSARDVSHTVRDQTLVSTASMLSDAYGALSRLSADPRIDPRRIGVMGFSKGGIAALYAAYRPVQRQAAPDGRRFALHIAYYPWCGLRLRQPETTGAPVLIQSGALDDLVPPERCAALIEASRGPPDSGGGPPALRQIIHPQARHAFDHPLLALFDKIPITAPSPAFCELQQRADGRFVETTGGQVVHADNLNAVLAGCSRPGHAGGNEAADAAAFAATLAFLEEAGFLTAPPRK
ncbi:MAG: dienelactone hydrolase family protein [Kiloniellaceae bacterium]